MQKREVALAKQARLNTAYVVNTIARVMGGTKDTVRQTYEKMRIPDAEEESGRRHYTGSLLDQLEQHAQWWAETHGDAG